ncbi:hypothetical protein PYW08_012413 [Mythimna loreyi]|uniref:Uncharacterized protein n=1 Tax=Mythimna loreyi TaxID=667449 RepID=A0ACC2Q0Y8_9NEOP|nr:hypothetical protein PYW08_012413 [Mythimna loreyi]
MEKLSMCRVCLAQDVRMFVVVNKNLQELYERLTGSAFVTGDSRPMLACFICYTKLKQCCQLQRKCLEAEERLAQMMNEDYELNPPINQDHFRRCNKLTISPVVYVSIESDDACQAECDPIKVELPDVCERLDDVIEPEEEHQSDDVKLENLYNSCSEDIPAQPSESDTEDYIPLIEIKTDVEVEQEVSRKKRRASDTTRAAAANKRKLHIRGKVLEDVITKNQKKNEESDTRVALNTSNYIPKFIEPLTNTAPRVNISAIETALETNCYNNIKNRNLKKPYTCIRRGVALYKCDICQHSFNKKGNLIKHIRTHTGEKPYKCEQCQRSFSQKGNLTNHIRSHTGEKPYKCQECQCSFSRKSYLINHTRTHTGEKPYKCEECQLCFSYKSCLRQHIRIHTGEKSYKCEECQRNFSQKFQLISHIRTHTGEKPYKCKECQLCFSQKSTLTAHIRTHTGDKPYKCEECKLCFGQKASLICHIRTHTGEKPYKCHECRLCFKNKHHLTTHCRMHTGEKPYKCKECQRSFSQKSCLITHIRTHTGEKPYKCEECQRGFSQKSSLTTHVRTHTGEKPYKCEQCQLCFSLKSSLNNHIRTHTGERASY